MNVIAILFFVLKKIESLNFGIIYLKNNNSMRKTVRLYIFVFFFSSIMAHATIDENRYEEIINTTQLKEGFFNFYMDEKQGKIYLEIQELKKEFLYISFLAAGLGSNDIGLDRGQIGMTGVVRFERYGPKVLLIQSNYDYRAESQNADELKSVEEAFAQSVLGGFKIIGEKENNILIDISEFVIRDVHNVVGALKSSKQGSYSLDKNRSVIYHENTKNFEFNSEFEALLTFSGKPEGAYVRDVVPSPNSITVRQRHSFVSLPDANYQKRVFDPRAGYFSIDYLDFATPIDEDIHKRFISRHRLQKKNPKKKISEPIKPIIYYLDRGAPEPIRSALIEGASWWNEAFDAAGFKHAFQVKLLPEGVDPLDVRYNIIQWVHRSTRGWSYGGSIRDPRTGEIIKGHVSLGSLRVRQDFLIAQGLLSPYKKGQNSSKELTEMALARLRQLSAHEVGHTLGLAHNYIASTYGRGSVMDYPHPLIKLNEEGEIDLSDAYAVGIGEWDKLAISYGYSEFTNDQTEINELKNILEQGIKRNIVFLSDQDARPKGSAHPKAHLWDNGVDAGEELSHILKIRKQALADFSENTIRIGEPMTKLEDVLVPLYFLHRYQLEAAVKVIGGLEYNYAMRGDGNYSTKFVDPDVQLKTLDAVLETMQPNLLALDESIIKLIPPKPLGYSRGRENIESQTGLTFDPIAAAKTAAKMTVDLLLHPHRCNRLIEHHARDANQPSFNLVLNQVYKSIQNMKTFSGLETEIKYIVEDLFIDQLIFLSQNELTSLSVRAASRLFLSNIMDSPGRGNKSNYLKSKIEKFINNPILIQPTKALVPPDGSPIGSVDYSIDFIGVQCTSFH